MGIAIGLIGATIVIILSGYVFIEISNVMNVDSCLDLGGQWDYKLEKCDK